MELYEELRAKSNDLGLPDDEIEACALSKRFITSFCKYVESLFGQVKSADGMPPRGDLFSLDLSGLQNTFDGNASEDASNENDSLDVTVNSGISCR